MDELFQDVNSLILSDANSYLIHLSLIFYRILYIFHVQKLINNS